MCPCQRRELDAGDADPAGGRVHEGVLTHAQRTLGEERVVRRGEHLGEPACLGPLQGVGSRCRHTLVRKRELGLPTAADERHDTIADREAFDVTAERDDLTGELHARDVRRATGRSRIQARVVAACRRC